MVTKPSIRPRVELNQLVMMAVINTRARAPSVMLMSNDSGNVQRIAASTEGQRRGGDAGD